MFNWLRSKFETKTAISDPALLAEIFGLSTNTAAGVPVTPETALRVPAVLAAVRVISEAVATLPAYTAHKVADEYERDDSHPAHALLTDSWNESISACAGRW